MKSQFASLASFVKKVTWQRLGYILEHVVEENELAQIRNLPGSLMYMPLSTSAEDNTSERNSRWKININVQIEKDDL